MRTLLKALRKPGFGSLLALSLAGALLGTGCYAEDDAYVSADVGIAPQVQVTAVDDFYSPLAPYGTWYDSDYYGDIWCPSVGVGWSPYTNGHWVYTQYGWTFAGNEPWGWAAYHYGNWVQVGSCGDGWGWVPGVEWGPAWVDWRTWGGYTAWAPMPPRAGYIAHFGANGAPPVVNRPIPHINVAPPAVNVPGGGVAGAPVAGVNGSSRWNVVQNGALGAPNLSGQISHPGTPLAVGSIGPSLPARPAGASTFPGYGTGYGSRPAGTLGPWGSATRGPSPSVTAPASPYGSYGVGGPRVAYGSYGSYGGGMRAYTPPSAPHYSAPSVGGYRSFGGGGGSPHFGGGGGVHFGGGGFHGGGRR